MQCQEIRPKTGDVVTLRNGANSYWLPDGLADGSKATVIGAEYGSLIIEQDGKKWSISDRCIRHEFLYEVNGRWLSHDHPEVLRRLRKGAKS